MRHVDDITAVTEPITEGWACWTGRSSRMSISGASRICACDAVAAGYRARGQPHWALRDRQVLLIDGNEVTLL